MKKIVFLVLLVLVIFASHGFPGKLSVLAELSNPGVIEIDGDELFVLDDVQVYVYSLQDYRFLRKFGKKGEGPGELLPAPDLPITMQVGKEYVLLNSFNKMIYFTKTGKMIKEKRIPFIVFQVIPFGKNYAVTKFIRTNEGGSQVSLLIFSAEFKELKNLYETTLLNDQGKGRIAFPLTSVYIQCLDNQLFLVDQQKEFEIQRFDLEGNRLTPIKKSYQKIKVTEAYKKESWEWIKLQPAYKNAPDIVKKMLYFLEYLPVTKNFLAKNNKIYLQTYKTKDSLYEFFILDINGNVLKTVFLPGAKKESIRPNPAVTYAFQDNKYYYLEENLDEEEWELHGITY
ncbi:MAG: 6-bladed beta-propeller [Candidatus Aminicenantes bacterium]|nr:MAG: 6-bladed beta-propeller [Candidatus Aminicenantes bacterium]